MRARTWATLLGTSVVVAGLTGAAVLSVVHGDGSQTLTGPTPAAATSRAVAEPTPPPGPTVLPGMSASAPAVPAPLVPAALVPTAPPGLSLPGGRPPTVGPAVLGPAPASRNVAGLPCSLPAGGEGACVSLSRQRAWLVRHGDVVMSVPVQTGKKGSTTPTGRFSVLSKDAHHRSREFDDAPMPWSVFFYPGDAFHTGSLSQRSNGCVHLGNTAARAFYSALSVGDPVQVVR